jgi:hypothetical protein
MTELSGSLGFAAPRTERTLWRKRAVAIELIATFSLTISLVIAIAAVSLGNRSLSRDDGFERRSMPAPVDMLVDRASGWFVLKAEQ